jgi:hypothetical protein
MKYKSHYSLSWFMPFLGDNSPMSSGLILKMNSGYNGGEQRDREVREVKGGMISYPLPEGQGAFYRPRGGRITMI